jgi:hypothetical protein
VDPVGGDPACQCLGDDGHVSLVVVEVCAAGYPLVIGVTDADEQM